MHQNEDAILEGEFHEALFDKSKYEAQIRDIIKISVEKIYQSEEVIGKEIAGFKMLSYLLDIYTQAFLADTENEDVVYVLNVRYHKSTDGGKTFKTFNAPHGDHHDLWIAPENNQRLFHA